jgi:hypothetical protein
MADSAGGAPGYVASVSPSFAARRSDDGCTWAGGGAQGQRLYSGHALLARLGDVRPRRGHQRSAPRAMPEARCGQVCAGGGADGHGQPLVPLVALGPGAAAAVAAETCNRES